MFHLNSLSLRMYERLPPTYLHVMLIFFQASNFLRAFRTLREASALGLLLPDTDESLGRVNYPQLIQSWQRFVLQQLHQVRREEYTVLSLIKNLIMNNLRGWLGVKDLSDKDSNKLW